MVELEGLYVSWGLYVSCVSRALLPVLPLVLPVLPLVLLVLLVLLAAGNVRAPACARERFRPSKPTPFVWIRRFLPFRWIGWIHNDESPSPPSKTATLFPSILDPSKILNERN